MPRVALGIALFLMQSFCALAIDVPQLKTRVTDLAGILTPDQIATLEAKLQSFETSDSTQIAVLIIPSLEGDPIEDYSMRVADAWKIGQKERDNGAILLISMRDRMARIEVGYGLESNLTDARTSQIIRNEISPRFREGDYYGGIDAAVTAMIQSVRGMYKGDSYPAGRSARPASGRFFNLLIMLLFPLLWILSATGKWGGGVIGAGAGVLLPYTLITHSLPILLIGSGVGALLGAVMGAVVRAGSKGGRGGPGSFGGPFFWGGGGGFRGGFGGGGGFGGFSGGGGGFGGGGSSGSW
jgi:uncharacterized protein